MDVLPSNFRTLLFCGIWKDDLEKEPIIRIVYRLIVITMLFYVTIGELVSLLYRNDIGDISDHLLLPLCYIALIFKMFNFLIRRSDLIRLLEKFRSKMCQPQTFEEFRIVSKYFRIAADIHKYFTTFVFVCSITIVIWPLIQSGSSEVELPLTSYNPYDTTKRSYFYLTYLIQGLTEIYGAVINSCFDTTTYGFILLATGQFELCCSRIKSIINKGFSFNALKQKWTIHHLLALSIVQDIQLIFIGVIAPFFLIMLLLLCVIIFQLYKEKLFSVEFLVLSAYYSLFMIRAFLYCWLGNGLLLKSHDIANAVMDSDWTKYDPRDRKYLLLIIQTGQRGIKISLRGQFALSIQTFTWMMRTSYGAFNLLKRISEV